MKIIIILAMLFFSGNLAFAQDYSDDYSDDRSDRSDSNQEQKVTKQEYSNYLGENIIELSEREKKALRLSQKFFERGPDPVLVENGKLMYVHGASTPTILASPLQICDVELEAGEQVNEIIVGDSARWMVETGSSGSGAQETVHLFIKPVDSGLETSAIVTTNRRIYHLRLISQREKHTPYVGFTYADNIKRHFAQKSAQEREDKYRGSTVIDGQNMDLSQLNFNYQVNGSASWKPERVYDNGQQIFIRLPEKISEMPILIVRKGSKNIMVNYRVKGQTMVVDGLFEKIALILGIGMSKKEITVVREDKI